MKISIVQPDLVWEDKKANFSYLGKLILPLINKTDLVILPEMFNTGFSMNTSGLGEPMKGLTYEWMIETAKKCNFGICGSYIVKDGNKFFNRFAFVTPEEDLYYYDKRHLFSMGDEDRYFTPGTSSVVFSFRGILISPFICYDLRFPVWSRNRNDYDLAIYSANWPEARKTVWETLLKARAIENQCYVAGSNRIGTDGNGLSHIGNSMIINPRGEILKSAGINEECSVTADISKRDLVDFRKKFNVLKDADDFELKL